MALSAEERRQLQLARDSQKVNLSPQSFVYSDARTSYLDISRPLSDAEYSRQQDNPPFIFPGPTTRTMGGSPYKPIRGYIRRLNEFYDRMSDKAVDIVGRRCNFQFQPETIVRSVSGNSYDTQYFFNQEPGQLTVPIPGQSTYGLKLLFNREAEVTSGYYMSKGTKVYAGSVSDRFDPLLETSPEIYEFVEGNYQPSWVTKIGVLADIMVLDGVIGQGISKETLTTIQKIAEAQSTSETSTTTENENDDSTKDEQDKTSEINKTASNYWLDPIKSNPNLGNQAFLVPTPVRIMLSNYMMIEGFVLSSTVNFHKFSKKFIPTQATVELSIQALYIGFAKNNTILANAPRPESSENSSDPKTKTQAEIDVNKATLDGVRTLYKSATHVGAGKDLLNYILKTDPQQNFNFTIDFTDAGKDYRINTLAKDNGGEPSFNWEGKISIYWAKHITGASNTRQPTRTSAIGGTLVSGHPIDIEYWGTKNNPLIIAKGSGEIYEDLRITPISNYVRHIIGLSSTFATTLGFAQSDAKWDMQIPEAITIRPFEQDVFNVKLEIKITLQRYGVSYPIGQKITFEDVLPCGEDSLFKNLSLSNTSQIGVPDL